MERCSGASTERRILIHLAWCAKYRRRVLIAKIANRSKSLLWLSSPELHRWRREFRQGPGNAFPGLGRRRWEEGRVAQLERKIGQQALEIDFLKGCLQRIDEQRKLQALAGKPLSTSRSKPKGTETRA